MATVVTGRLPPSSTAPDMFERILAIGAGLIFIAAATAVAKGYSEWNRLPLMLWVHLATIGIALILTPIMLLRKRGDRLHRRLGKLWVGSMLLTAVASFFVRESNNGGFSLIHILSFWTMIQVPFIYWSARTHDIVRHRLSVRAMVLGALLIAGFFTFPFNRQLGQWLFRPLFGHICTA